MKPISSIDCVCISKVGWLAENAGFIAVDSGIPVYRLYSQYSGDHHYTADSNERNHLISVGWSDEGVSFYTLPEGEGFPVYRLYNPNAITASHHYTLDEAERDMLISLGWQDEGVAFQSLHDIYTRELTGPYSGKGTYYTPTCHEEGNWGDIGFRDMPGYFYDGWGHTCKDRENHADYGWIFYPAFPGDTLAPAHGVTGNYYMCKGCAKYLVELLDGTWILADKRWPLG